MDHRAWFNGQAYRRGSPRQGRAPRRRRRWHGATARGFSARPSSSAARAAASNARQRRTVTVWVVFRSLRHRLRRTPARRRSTSHIRHDRLRPGATADRSGTGHSGDPLLEPIGHGVESQPLLAHVVAMTNGHAAVLERLEIDREAEGRTDLIVPAVALPNVSGLVVVDEHTR